MAGMFECHDKSRFDVTAISIGPDDNSEIRQRLKASFEHFIDAKTYSDDQIAKLQRVRDRYLSRFDGFYGKIHERAYSLGVLHQFR